MQIGWRFAQTLDDHAEIIKQKHVNEKADGNERQLEPPDRKSASLQLKEPQELVQFEHFRSRTSLDLSSAIITAWFESKDLHHLIEKVYFCIFLSFILFCV